MPSPDDRRVSIKVRRRGYMVGAYAAGDDNSARFEGVLTRSLLAMPGLASGMEQPRSPEGGPVMSMLRGGSITSTVRCCAVESGVGRCQLRADHSGFHAISSPIAFTTWDANGLSRWSTCTPPLWLFDLDWAPRLQPAVSAYESSPSNARPGASPIVSPARAAAPDVHSRVRRRAKPVIGDR
jgi:hypothetical protein